MVGSCALMNGYHMMRPMTEDSSISRFHSFPSNLNTMHADLLLFLPFKRVMVTTRSQLRPTQKFIRLRPFASNKNRWMRKSHTRPFFPKRIPSSSSSRTWLRTTASLPCSSTKKKSSRSTKSSSNSLNSSGPRILMGVISEWRVG